MNITFETKAWVSEHNRSTPDDLRTPEGAAGIYFSRTDLASVGYSYAGTATVTVDLLDNRSLVDNKIAALREQASGIRAEATAKVTRIESQIQQLLCIENSALATPADPDEMPF